MNETDKIQINKKRKGMTQEFNSYIKGDLTSKMRAKRAVVEASIYFCIL